ncbi:MAG: hypothetical protein ACREEM_49760, partial [Blastocatellia bacterium]
MTFPTLAERAGVPNVSATTVLRYPANFPVASLRGQQIADPSRATASNPQGRHLLRRPDINQVTPAVQSAAGSAVNINALRPYQGFTTIRLYQSSAASNYHALQVGVTRRYSKSLTYSFAYTWSKVLTDASGQDDGVENLLN